LCPPPMIIASYAPCLAIVFHFLADPDGLETRNCI
jgi:hypothetical protein